MCVTRAPLYGPTWIESHCAHATRLPYVLSFHGFFEFPRSDLCEFCPPLRSCCTFVKMNVSFPFKLEKEFNLLFDLVIVAFSLSKRGKEHSQRLSSTSLTNILRGIKSWGSRSSLKDRICFQTLMFMELFLASALSPWELEASNAQLIALIMNLPRAKFAYLLRNLTCSREVANFLHEDERVKRASRRSSVSYHGIINSTAFSSLSL